MRLGIRRCDATAARPPAGPGAARAGALGATALAAALLAAAAPAADAAPREHGAPQPRLVVADGTSGTVRVLDATRGGRALKTLDVGGPATLATTDGGRYVLAAQHARDRVDAIDAGAWSQAHGDHHHHHTAAPRLLPFRLSVPRPAHVVPHGEQVAIFADGTGEARVYGLAALRRAAGTPFATLRSGTAHHGVAVPFGERAVLSKLAPGAEAGGLPSSLDVVDRAGAVLSSTACPALHGEVSRGDWAAFACADGVALIRPGAAGGAAPSARKLAYPAGASAERRAFTLRSDAAGRRIVGGFGSAALVVIDRASGEARTIEVGREVSSFAVDGRSGAVLALTTDGLLRRYDPATGRRTASRRVVAGAFVQARDRPTPKLSVAGGLAAVSDPARRRVTIVRTGGLKVLRTLNVPGAPTQVALAGTLD